MPPTASGSTIRKRNCSRPQRRRRSGKYEVRRRREERPGVASPRSRLRKRGPLEVPTASGVSRSPLALQTSDFRLSKRQFLTDPAFGGALIGELGRRHIFDRQPQALEDSHLAVAAASV